MLSLATSKQSDHPLPSQSMHNLIFQTILDDASWRPGTNTQFILYGTLHVGEKCYLDKDALDPHTNCN